MTSCINIFFYVAVLMWGCASLSDEAARHLDSLAAFSASLDLERRAISKAEKLALLHNMDDSIELIAERSRLSSVLVRTSLTERGWHLPEQEDRNAYAVTEDQRIFVAPFRESNPDLSPHYPNWRIHFIEGAAL